MGIPNIVKSSTGGSWRVEGWRHMWTWCRFLGSEAVERGEVFIKHCRGRIQKWKMNVFMSCCSHINPQNFCQAQKRIPEGVRRAKPCKRPTAKHLSVRECSDELRVLVPSFICRDEQGLWNLGKRKRETGHKGAVERGGMKEWEEEKASQWGFLSNSKVVPKLGDQLSYFYQGSLMFKYMLGNPSKFLVEVRASEPRKLGRDYLSLDSCTCIIFWPECSSNPHPWPSSITSHD